jgi:hypothetical protein
MFKGSKQCNVCQPEGIYYPVEEYPVENYDGPQINPTVPRQAIPNDSPAPAALPNLNDRTANRYGTTVRPSASSFGIPPSAQTYHSQTPVTVPMQSQSTYIPRPQSKPKLLNLNGIGHKMKSAFSSMSDKLKIRRTSASTAVPQSQFQNKAFRIERQETQPPELSNSAFNVRVVGTPPSQFVDRFEQTSQAGPSQVAKNPLSIPTVTNEEIENWPYARTSDSGLQLNSPAR